MAGKISKNAGRSGAQKLLCSCGSEINMFTEFKNGKSRQVAICNGCKKRGRRPRDLM